MDNPKSQLLEKLQSAANILVTVSRNPSVDQLAATVGLTLVLNKLDKHATAVFSGEVPSTIEFLQPEETLEKTTDSLRDFIIALDKTKADKLRYKVEDQLVRIFITPYRTSITQDDLEFSQGDFNVDVVVALGVQRQEDLDEAITAHGRILHDATVASINVATTESGLGTINWSDTAASSLSELVTELTHDLGQNLLDGQIATALLTGIVAETARFSNEKTSPHTMSISAELMAAGANQQLVASKLELGSGPAPADAPAAAPDTPASTDGTLEIAHAAGAAGEADSPASDPATDKDSNEAGSSSPEAEAEPPGNPDTPKQSRLIVEPPTLGGMLTANTHPEELDPTTDPLSLPAVNRPILNRDTPAMSLPVPTSSETPEQPEPPAEPEEKEPPMSAEKPAEKAGPAEPATPLEAAATEAVSNEPPKADSGPSLPPVEAAEPALTEAPVQPTVPLTDLTAAPAWTPPAMDASKKAEADAPLANGPAEAVSAESTLADIEEAVHSPHLNAPQLDEARDEVLKALNSAPPAAPEPVQALNAQPMVDNLNVPAPSEPEPNPAFTDILHQAIPQVPPSAPPGDEAAGSDGVAAFDPQAFGAVEPADSNGAAAKAPPVPPPFPFPVNAPPSPGQNGGKAAA